MHPILADQAARVLVQERLRTAATARRVRGLRPARPRLRERAGTGLVRAGERLRQRPAGVHHAAARPC